MSLQTGSGTHVVHNSVSYSVGGLRVFLTVQRFVLDDMDPNTLGALWMFYENPRASKASAPKECCLNPFVNQQDVFLRLTELAFVKGWVRCPLRICSGCPDILVANLAMFFALRVPTSCSGSSCVLRYRPPLRGLCLSRSVETAGALSCSVVFELARRVQASPKPKLQAQPGQRAGRL